MISPPVPRLSHPSFKHASVGSHWKQAFFFFFVAASSPHSQHTLRSAPMKPQAAKQMTCRHEGAHVCIYSLLLAYQHACAETYTAWQMPSA